MFDDWLDILLRGSLDLNLPAITLSFGDGTELTGSGHLTWNPDAGLHVRAVTGGVSEMYARLRQSGTPGQLLPDEDYLTASGRTQCGWDMTASRVPFGGSTVDPDSEHVVWDLTPELLEFTRARLGPRPCNRIIRALLGPPPKDWIRPTRTEIHNEHFGGWTSSLSNQGLPEDLRDRYNELIARRQDEALTPEEHSLNTTPITVKGP